MTTNMTMKQRKWLKLYLENGNASESAMQVYDCKDRESAAQIGWENLRKLDFSDFLEEAGITDNLLQKKIMEGLDATRTVSAVNTGKNASASTTDFVDVPDFLARHKYLETALKLKRKLNDTNVNINETKVLIMPAELIEKYDITSNPSSGSEGQP